MTCDPRTSKALVDALFGSNSMGLCLFDSDGRVTSVEGAATIWAPPAGDSIYDSNLFIGMREEFERVKTGGRSFLLSGVSIGSDDGRALDVRVLWIEDLSLFAAMSHSATERNQLQMQVSQIVRDNRLLEQRVREQQEKIAEQAALMEMFIRHVPAAAAMLDSNLDPMMLSQRWVEEFGDPSLGDDPEVAGSPLRFASIAAALRMAMDTGVTSSRVEKVSQRGMVTWKRWEQTPWRRADRSVGGTILFIEDVSDEIRKTVRLQSQTEDLRKLTQELGFLGRAVADGLSAPLQRIEKLCAKSRGEMATASALEQEQLLDDIAAAVARLIRMLQSLREYIGTSRRQFAMTPFDLSQAVESAAEAMKAEIRATNAHIVLHPMLSVMGDLELMTRVFRHLIHNAIAHGGGAPTINIDCHDEDGVVVVRFADDGPGIPAHLRNAAFEPFTKLDFAGGTPGEGMGLAECRKIVEMHGGAMVIDPDYDTGLRLIINLPQHAIGSIQTRV